MPSSINSNSDPVTHSAQVREVVPAVLVDWTLKSKSLSGPPTNGMKLPIKAEIRRVLIVPVPRMLAATFQLGSLVRPPRATKGLLKVMTVESKVKSPSNATMFAPPVVLLSTSEQLSGIRTTPDGEGEIVATGNETVIGKTGSEHPFGTVSGGG